MTADQLKALKATQAAQTHTTTEESRSSSCAAAQPRVPVVEKNMSSSAEKNVENKKPASEEPEEEHQPKKRVKRTSGGSDDGGFGGDAAGSPRPSYYARLAGLEIVSDSDTPADTPSASSGDEEEKALDSESSEAGTGSKDEDDDSEMAEEMRRAVQYHEDVLENLGPGEGASRFPAEDGSDITEDEDEDDKAGEASEDEVVLLTTPESDTDSDNLYEEAKLYTSSAGSKKRASEERDEEPRKRSRTNSPLSTPPRSFTITTRSVAIRNKKPVMKEAGTVKRTVPTRSSRASVGLESETRASEKGVTEQVEMEGNGKRPFVIITEKRRSGRGISA